MALIANRSKIQYLLHNCKKFYNGLIFIGLIYYFSVVCPQNMFLCPNTQICTTLPMLCDGDNDCPGGEDENTDYCKGESSIKIPISKFQYQNSNIKIPISKFQYHQNSTFTIIYSISNISKRY